jgi:hypothetical protein
MGARVRIVHLGKNSIGGTLDAPRHSRPGSSKLEVRISNSLFGRRSSFEPSILDSSFEIPASSFGGLPAEIF